ncbi:MEDS domain-containing protein [Geodermatophilus sp. SYSU D00703]
MAAPTTTSPCSPSAAAPRPLPGSCRTGRGARPACGTGRRRPVCAPAITCAGRRRRRGVLRAVRSFLDEGRRRGEQLLLTGESEPDLLSALGALPERDALLASGRLEIRPTAERYGADRGLDPLGQVQAFRAELDAALERGRTGLRVAADITALARNGLENRRQLHVYERLADTLIGSSPLTGMCLYDASLGEEVLGPLTVLHPVQHHGDRQPLAHLSGRGARLPLHGEIADHLADDVFPALFDLACAAPGDVELDLSDMIFLDRAGARTLARTAQLLTDVGVRLRLVSAQPLVARVLQPAG